MNALPSSNADARDDASNDLASGAGEPCAMVVVAAGQGRRFGSERPKQYLDLAGAPVLWRTLEALHAHPLIDPIQPVIAADALSLWEEEIAPRLAALPRVRPPVMGGAERQDSVLAGLRALDLAADAWVGIHDAARPILSLALLNRLLVAREGRRALIAALPVTDTVKRGCDGWIEGDEDRARLWLAQTPQLFHHGLILAAHARPRQHPATDDAALISEMGHPVWLVMGEAANLKITRPEDLPLVAWRLAQLREASFSAPEFPS